MYFVAISSRVNFSGDQGFATATCEIKGSPTGVFDTWPKVDQLRDYKVIPDALMLVF